MNNKELKKNKVFLRTFGCQMNERDSEALAGLLQQTGFVITDIEKDADVVIFNTCSVRKRAEDRVWSEAGRVAKSRRGAVRPIIGIVGCMAQNFGAQTFERSEYIDFAAGPKDIQKVPEIIRSLLQARKKPGNELLFERKIYEVDGVERDEALYHTGYYAKKGVASVVLSHGCSNYCTYCVVPYVRGNVAHRDPQDIMREIQEAVGAGVTRITLLGQNVNAYEWQGVTFVKLLEMINGIKGLEEFDFLTSHPKDTKKELFYAMRDLEKLVKYLHLPVQSGSNKVLATMNRGYTREIYLELVDHYRAIVKDGRIGTDVIVGFPGETENDFEGTRSLLEQVRFDCAFLFKYSPRPGTKAAALEDDVSLKEKERRHRIILELQKAVSQEVRKEHKC